jgi:ankyrin repeat protein
MRTVEECEDFMFGSNDHVTDDELIRIYRTCVDRDGLFRRALELNHTRSLRLLIADHFIDVNSVDENQCSLLHHAYLFSSLAHINMLLDAGARTDVVDASNAPPWFYAASSPCDEVMVNLLASGVDVNTVDRFGHTLLHLAAANDYVEDERMLALLIAAGANVTARDQGGNTPCHFAAQNIFCVYAMQQFTQLHQQSLCDIDAACNAGYTPCILAAVTKNNAVLELLIRAGANVHAVANDGMTALSVALQNDDAKSVELLVDANVDVVNTVDLVDGMTTLHLASQWRNHRLIAKLLAAGAHVNATNNYGETPCHMVPCVSKASAEDAVRSMALLIDAGADVNAANRDGSTPLHLAVQCGLTECVSLLIRAGADIEAKDDDGWTPLFFAVDDAVAAMLIAANADVNLHDHNGWNACHFACTRPRVLALLIAAGANPQQRGFMGETALHWAADREHSIDAMSVLLRADADVNLGDKHGNSAAHWAALAGRIDNLKFLLEHGANIEQRNNAGKTVLLVAVSAVERAVETTRWLMHAGADIDVINDTMAHGAAASALPLLRRLGVNLNGADDLGNTACHQARDRAALHMLFALGATMSAVNYYGQTPLESFLGNSRLGDDLALTLASAGFACGMATEVERAEIGAVVIACGGRVSAELDADELLRREADTIDSILQHQMALFRLRAWQVCIGLQSLRVSALEMCKILAYIFAPLESLVPFHVVWDVVRVVKHFERPRRLPRSRFIQ